eukprot:1627373-Pyramimonas_sp.AAC.2
MQEDPITRVRRRVCASGENQSCEREGHIMQEDPITRGTTNRVRGRDGPDRKRYGCAHAK